MNKSDTVAELLLEAAKQINFETTCGHLRLLEITRHKINRVISDGDTIESLNSMGYVSYRVEETPDDQMDMEPTEFLLPVAHFQNESYRNFGVPFLLKVKDVSVGARPF